MLPTGKNTKNLNGIDEELCNLITDTYGTAHKTKSNLFAEELEHLSHSDSTKSLSSEHSESENNETDQEEAPHYDTQQDMEVLWGLQDSSDNAGESGTDSEMDIEADSISDRSYLDEVMGE